MEASKQFSDWVSNWRQNPYLRKFASETREIPLMDEDDADHGLFVMSEWYFLCQGWYFQYRRNLISDDSWERLADFAVGGLTKPYVAAWSEKATIPVSDQFRTHIDQRRITTSGWERPDLSSLIRTVTEALEQREI